MHQDDDDDKVLVGRWVQAPSILLAIFLLCVICIALRNFQMFFKPYGIRHRLCGLVYLSWLSVGIWDMYTNRLIVLYYDIILGILGTTLTLTAAFEFKKVHQHAKNDASGVLDDDKIVSYSEMLEHGFYQILNLCQIVFLHSLRSTMPIEQRLGLAFLVVLPWYFRSFFPVNSFSSNYTDNKPTSLTGIMYRFKKYQYVFYKHVLLHGLNVSAAVNGANVATRPYFRLYWMCLNTAYVMEFFLQTLVKKKYLSQGAMLALNQLLMAISSVAAVRLMIVIGLDFRLAALSVALNFANRGHEIMNASMVLFAGYLSYELSQ